MENELRHPLRDGLSSQATEPEVSALRASIPDASYQHGVDVARSVVFRVLRAMNVSDEVFYAVAGATYEVRGNRPIYGAPPAPTEAEQEIFSENIAKAARQ